MWQLEDQDGNGLFMSMNGTLDDGEPFEAKVPIMMISESEFVPMEFLMKTISSALAFIEGLTGERIVEAFLSIPLDTSLSRYGVIDLLTGDHIEFDGLVHQA